MDKKRDHIDTQIKSSFDSQERKAPTGLWFGIADSLDLTEDEIAIKESFANAQPKSAPKNGWGGVKRQLIIDGVWENILTIQERRRRRVVFWWWSGSLGLLIAFFALAWGNWHTSGSQVQEKGIEQNTFDIEKITRPENQNKPYASEHSSRNGTTVNVRSDEGAGFNDRSKDALLMLPGENRQDIPVNAHAFTPEGKNNHSAEERKADNEIKDESQNLLTGNWGRLPVLAPDTLIIGRTMELQELSMTRLPSFYRFEFGVLVSGGNTWLFNNDVKNGFDRNSLIKNKLSTGYSVGFEGVYNFNRKHSAYLGYDAFSAYQQSYSYYQSGRLLDKRISIKQQKLMLGYKLKFMNAANEKRSFTVHTGAFLSHSLSGQTEINNVAIAETNLENIDFGLSLRGGVQRSFNRFNLEYGVRSEIGLYNITATSASLPKKFDYATSFMLGGYVSLRYAF